MTIYMHPDDEVPPLLAALVRDTQPGYTPTGLTSEQLAVAIAEERVPRVPRDAAQVERDNALVPPEFRVASWREAHHVRAKCVQEFTRDMAAWLDDKKATKATEDTITKAVQDKLDSTAKRLHALFRFVPAESQLLLRRALFAIQQKGAPADDALQPFEATLNGPQLEEWRELRSWGVHLIRAIEE